MVRTTLLALLSLSPLLGAQSTDVAAILGKARESLERGQKEEAAAMLRDALRRSRSIEGEGERTALRSSIAELFKKADTNQAARRNAEGEAVKALKGIAASYSGAGWHPTAIELLEIVDILDPQAIAAELAEARRLAGSEAASPDLAPASAAELIAKAEAALGRGEKEAAAAALRRARRDRSPGDAARASTANRIEEFMKKADDRDGARRQAEANAARQLIGAAELYTRARWFTTAVELLALAQRLDPEAARRPLDEAHKRAGTAPGTQKTPPQGSPQRDLLREYLTGGSEHFKTGWTIGPASVESPSIEEVSAMILSGPKVVGDTRISVDFLLGAPAGKAALVFGARGPEDFYLLEVHHAGEQTDVQLVRMHEQEPGVLWSDFVEFSRQARADWMCITVEIRGLEVAAKVGDQQFRTRRTGTEALSGMVGLFVAGNSENKKPVKFRRLTVEKL